MIMKSCFSFCSTVGNEKGQRKTNFFVCFVVHSLVSLSPKEWLTYSNYIIIASHNAENYVQSLVKSHFY